MYIQYILSFLQLLKTVFFFYLPIPLKKFNCPSPFFFLARVRKRKPKPCFTCTNSCFVKDEVMAGCPKLGHTTLVD